ncbi:MG2 domain-containing protein [Flavobacterium sp.]|uniref:alpha-2-macroglobulin family protein n=1 Tax=Flavobacterium sp. TaxID=239 RepID=UPI0039E5935C
MKKILFVLLLNASALFAQHNRQEWEKVTAFENEGKIQSANEVVLKIHAEAVASQEETQIIKCFFHLAKYMSLREERSEEQILDLLKNDLANVSIPSKAILQLIYAKCLINYKNENWGEIRSRTAIDSTASKDFLTWTIQDFEAEINSSYHKILENETVLKKTSLTAYEPLFNYFTVEKFKTETLYEFLLKEMIASKGPDINWYDPQNVSPSTRQLFANTTQFLSLQPDSLPQKNQPVLKLLQLLEKQAPTPENQFLRLLACYQKITPAAPELIKALERLQKTTTDRFLLQKIRYEKVVLYANRVSKNEFPNGNIEMVKILDSIIAEDNHTNAYKLAMAKRGEITSKKIAFKLERFLYNNQQSRALITYKNVDSIRISYFKIDHKTMNRLESDQKPGSILESIVKNNLPIRRFSKALVNKKDYYEYTTEAILPPVGTGVYLVYFECDSDNQTTKPFTYDLITVTDLAAFGLREADREIYQVVDRKTGKPVADAWIQNGQQKAKTDKAGKAVFKISPNDHRGTPILFAKAGDTLRNAKPYIGYFGKQDDEEEEEKVSAKVSMFTDRGIYRPGQTVHFKGIAIQQKKHKMSTIAQLKLKLTLSDPHYKDLKTLEVTTNEFGSFWGEFTLPKNAETGGYQIGPEEPDGVEDDPKYNKRKDEHPFWDHVDFDTEDAFFNVEEYKRPKFEVDFETIKENLMVGQKASVTGIAKAFAGSMVTDAEVQYSVVRDTYYSEKRFYGTRETVATGQLKTDASGKFHIDFMATAPAGSDKKNRPVYHYTVQASVTDINGETHDGKLTAKAGYHALELGIGMAEKVRANEKNTLKLSSTNLNGQPIATKGTITIFFLHAPSAKFKQRIWERPELEGIPDPEFEKLFPYEHNEKATDAVGTLRHTINVDTEKEKLLALDFMANYDSGVYRAEFTAKDAWGNEITTSKKFILQQPNEWFDANAIVSLTAINPSPGTDGFVELQITSVIPTLYLHLVGAHNNNNFFTKEVELRDHKAMVRIPLPKDFYGSVKIGCETFFENDSYFPNLEVKVRQKNQTLTLEAESFRNKIEPGAVEKWSFQLSGDPKYAAEVLASMYDSSLDQFSSSYWNPIEFDDRHYNPFLQRTVLGIQKLTARIHQNKANPAGYKLHNESIRLNWFGFHFTPDPFQIEPSDASITRKSPQPSNPKLVYGTVTDVFSPLPSVVVKVRGTDRATQTDFDGYYEIEASPGEVLVFSFLGFSDEYMILGSSKLVDMDMQSDAIAVGEVVVTAQGISKEKKALGYAVAETDERTYEGNDNLLKTFTGRVAGVAIIEEDDALAGAAKKIIIRGYSTSSGSTGALIVIDGVVSEVTDMAGIIDANVASITILKDFQATALYGSRGANGVILVTTKTAVNELTQVKARTNLAEMAFFYPDLQTDKKGRFSFSFTAPEALTEWKFRLLAHNKKAESGYFQQSVLTQKDIMVLPNFPRFLREKDTLTLTVKVSNVTDQPKSGNALLQLFDASTMRAIDGQTANGDNLRNFTIVPFGNTTVSWKIVVPEGVQGIQYKVLAKAGRFSDGEENILPVLSNRMLVTESIPIWVKGNSKKEYVFDHLKNNTSATLRNQLFTLEYTANPIWLAIQSLPYLMEYEHECAEQTFARFYANALASDIIGNHPKLAAVLDTWRKDGQLVSALQRNEKLQSIVLSETPWLNDAQSEEEKKKRLALLFDLEKMKQSQQATFDQLKKKQLASGAFAWFAGGGESEFITRHILAGLGHLQKLNTKGLPAEKITEITQTALPFLDGKFNAAVASQNQAKLALPRNRYSELHYLYTRSFYLAKYPVNEGTQKNIDRELRALQSGWLGLSLYEKGMAALVLYRFGEAQTAHKILAHLKETASTHTDWGMYWKGNDTGHHWYQAPIETQALLIEAFSEISRDNQAIDEMKVWLIKSKQNRNWPTTKSTTEAIYALLLQGSDWLSVKGNTEFKIGNEKILTQKLADNAAEAETGYLKLNWQPEDIKPEMAQFSIQNKSTVPGYGGAYWQYFEDLDQIKSDGKSVLSVKKELYIKSNTNQHLQPIGQQNLPKIGSLVTVRLVITATENMEYVHLKDLRASCFEPVDVLSAYHWNSGLGYYQSTRDAATHFFFDAIAKGTYVIEYDIRVNNTGNFSNGISTIQSMYAPEFSSHTQGIRIHVPE